MWDAGFWFDFIDLNLVLISEYFLYYNKKILK